MLVIDFGRFGLLLREIGERIGAKIEMLSVPWGETVPLDQIAEAIERTGPEGGRLRPWRYLDHHGAAARWAGRAVPCGGCAVLCRCHRDYRRHGDRDRPLGRGRRHRRLAEMPGRPVGLFADHDFGSRGRAYLRRAAMSSMGIARPDSSMPCGPRIGSNYFDLAMVMDYWSDKRLNHHTEATTMLYGARECARVALGERAGGAFRASRGGRPRGGARARAPWD
jgi:(S)-ureidoglycine-glyoxylate aminotransferase